MVEICIYFFKNQYGNDITLSGLFVLLIINGKFAFNIDAYAIFFLCTPMKDAATIFRIQVSALFKTVSQERGDYSFRVRMCFYVLQLHILNAVVIFIESPKE